MWTALPWEVTTQDRAVVSVKCRRCKAHVGLKLPDVLAMRFEHEENRAATLAAIYRAMAGKG
jgi:hypothetical protein